MARYEAEQTNQLALLKRHMLEKRALLTQARQLKRLDTRTAALVRNYWNQVNRILSGIEQTGAAKEFCAELARDIESLQEIRASLETRREEPETEQQLETVRGLLAILMGVWGRAKKRARELADAQFAWLFAVNPAKPKKEPPRKMKERLERKAESSPADLAALPEQDGAPRELRTPSRERLSGDRKREREEN